MDGQNNGEKPIVGKLEKQHSRPEDISVTARGTPSKAGIDPVSKGGAERMMHPATVRTPTEIWELVWKHRYFPPFGETASHANVGTSGAVLISFFESGRKHRVDRAKLSSLGIFYKGRRYHHPLTTAFLTIEFGAWDRCRPTSFYRYIFNCIIAVEIDENHQIVEDSDLIVWDPVRGNQIGLQRWHPEIAERSSDNQGAPNA